jgi:hypothetical protein
MEVSWSTGQAYSGYNGVSETGFDIVIGVNWDVYGPKI